MSETELPPDDTAALYRWALRTDVRRCDLRPDQILALWRLVVRRQVRRGLFWGAAWWQFNVAAVAVPLRGWWSDRGLWRAGEQWLWEGEEYEGLWRRLGQTWGALWLVVWTAACFVIASLCLTWFLLFHVLPLATRVAMKRHAQVSWYFYEEERVPRWRAFDREASAGKWLALKVVPVGCGLYYLFGLAEVERAIQRLSERLRFF